MCNIVDIVPVSTEQPLGDDQKQLFEEEEDFTVVEEGKWSSPHACSILSYITALQLSYFYDDIALTWREYLFKDLPRPFYPDPWSTRLNKCFWVENASCSAWVG
jgi:hypothetical protein